MHAFDQSRRVQVGEITGHDRTYQYWIYIRPGVKFSLCDGNLPPGTNKVLSQDLAYDKAEITCKLYPQTAMSGANRTSWSTEQSPFDCVLKTRRSSLSVQDLI
jgi:hypothetical protein